MREFGRALAEHRKLKGLQQIDVATRAKVSYHTIVRWEGLNPPKQPMRANVITVAMAVGMDVNDALTMVGYEPMAPLPIEPVDPATTRGQVRDELDKLLPQMSDEQCKVLLVVARLTLGRAEEPAVIALDGVAQGFQMKSTVGFRMRMIVPGVAARIAAERRAHQEQTRLR
jgi:transcriptional regulator with XRE-family HTH domain